MSTHNVCFCGEIRKISAFFGWKKCLICCYVLYSTLILTLSCNSGTIPAMCVQNKSKTQLAIHHPTQMVGSSSNKWNVHKTKRTLTSIPHIYVDFLSLIWCYGPGSFSCKMYHNNPKYWDRQAFANSVDPDQMPQKEYVWQKCRPWSDSLIRVYTVCQTYSNIKVYSVCHT